MIDAGRGGGWAAHNGRGDRAKAAPSVSLLLARCGRHWIGFPAGLVRGVIAASDIVPVKDPPLRGLVWREGTLWPVTGIDSLLGVAERVSSPPAHGVLISSAYGPFCLLVDEAVDLVETPATSVKPMPDLVSRAIELPALDSAALLERTVLIVDPVRLLGPDGIAHLGHLAERIGLSRQ